MYEILVMEYLKRNGDPEKNKFLEILDYFYLNVKLYFAWINYVRETYF